MKTFLIVLGMILAIVAIAGVHLFGLAPLRVLAAGVLFVGAGALP